MISNPTIQGAYINIPLSDWKFFKELVQKMGWEVQTREELLDSFIESRPEKPSLSDEEISMSTDHHPIRSIFFRNSESMCIKWLR
jgi:hypothetical protein